ncbi:hypothetical protein ACFYOV_30930 [Streptomyces sp. NPDC005931]|uniref:hypothetical protein n=1 Tax=Streptomyces sp. NPDC005931 TaxID=3364737 RepID=UPI0036ADF637
MSRTAVLAPAVCVLATVAAVVSFTRSTWMGLAWLLLAGLTSNMAVYHVRRARTATRAGRPPAAAPTACASGGACGGCAEKVCR